MSQIEKYLFKSICVERFSEKERERERDMGRRTTITTAYTQEEEDKYQNPIFINNQEEEILSYFHLRLLVMLLLF